MKMTAITRLTFVAFATTLMLLLTTAHGQRRSGVRRTPLPSQENSQRWTGRSYKENINGVTLEMVLIPAGAFTMGSREEEVLAVIRLYDQKASTPQARREALARDPQWNFELEKQVLKGLAVDWLKMETPQHRVNLQSFYIGKYEVTQAQWQAVMGTNPSHFKGDNLPVENVSWNDAIEFCRKLSQMTGREYRLPSETEWEYACRAKTTGAYAGNLDSVGWYYENAGDARLSGQENEEKLRANNNRTHPVGQKRPNSFGLYDLHGNVWEWCQDIWHKSYYGAPTNGSAWLSGGNSNDRMIRGGSYSEGAGKLRSAYRGWASYDSGIPDIGFRVVAVSRK